MLYFKNIVLFIFCFAISLIVNGKGQSLPESKQISPSLLENLPLSFRKNVGQWDDRILYRGSSLGWGSNIYFQSNKVAFAFSRHSDINGQPNSLQAQLDEQFEYMTWNLVFKNSNPNVTVSSLFEENSHTNYYVGDVSKHHTNVPDCKGIRYANIYPGIDIQYYSRDHYLEHDYILSPGADISKIELYCEGVQKTYVGKNGKLQIETPWGTLEEAMPESYQMINGQKKKINVVYDIRENNSYGFKIIGKYDKSSPLVIDPIIVDWSIYMQGNPWVYSNRYSYDIAVDNSGNSYVTGFYDEAFPITSGVYNSSTTNNYSDAIVVKLAPNGSLIWATYIGGTSFDFGTGIKLSPQGNVFVCGIATSGLTTTAGAYKSTGGYDDIFVSKFTNNGALVYTSLIGGSDNDWACDITVNANEEAYVTGYTVNGATKFPTSNPLQAAISGTKDAIVFKLNAAGSALGFSTFLGGSALDEGTGIALSPNNDVYITGWTSSNNFPTTNGLYTSLKGTYDAFVTKLNSTGTSIIYSTYLGGSSEERSVNPFNTMSDNAPSGIEFRANALRRMYPGAIAVNSKDEATVVGATSSADFPIKNALYNTMGGVYDAFVTQFNSAGSSLNFSTFLGGLNEDFPFSVVINSKDEIFVSGWTFSSNFPTTSCAYDKTCGCNGQQSLDTDFFISKLDATATTLLYSTFIGGTATEYFCPRIAIKEGCADEVYFSGTSHSNNYPIVNPVGSFPTAFIGNHGFTDEPVVTKLKPKIDPLFVASPNVQCMVPVQFTDQSTGNCIWKAGPWTPTEWKWDFGDGSTSTEQNPTHTYKNSGNYSVKLVVGCPTDSITLQVIVPPGPNCQCSLVANEQHVNATCELTNGSATISTQPAGANITFAWTPNVSNTNTANNLAAGDYEVITDDHNGCKDTVTFTITNTLNPVVTITDKDVTCPGANDGSIDLTITSGTNPLTFAWNNNANTEDLSSLAPNTYSVIVTDPIGCTTTASAIITEPVVTPLSVNANGAAQICPGGNAALTAQAQGGSGTYAYTWEPPTPGLVGSTLNVTPNITTTYTVTVSDVCGTQPATSTVIVTVVNPPVITFTGDTLGCVPYCSKLLNTTANSASCAWDFGDGHTGTNCNEDHCYDTPGKYSVTLTVTDNNSCSASLTKNNWIEVIAIPTADFIANPQPASVWDTHLYFTDQSSTDAVAWNWDFGDNNSSILQNPDHTYATETAGEYNVTLTVENKLKCPATITKTIVIKSDWTFYIPNTFTPNGDGKNDTFNGRATGLTAYEMWVYDRWGNEIFYTNSLSLSWDGKVQGGGSGQIAQQDTYVWLVSLKDNVGKGHKYVGHVNLIK